MLVEQAPSPSLCRSRVPAAPSSSAVRVAGSFRDPDSFVYRRDGVLYRQINPGYRPHYDHLMDSGLHAELVERRMIVDHRQVDKALAATSEAYAVLEPELAAFISYPYEWCFSQLKDAALLTLDIQKMALAKGMTLKDCSAYNVQFQDGRPIFIDTASLEILEEGSAWKAYRQFCQHFLAPLALMARKDIRLGQLSRIHMDGVPLGLAAGLLGPRSYLSPSLLLHIQLHARMQTRYQDKPVKPAATRKVSKHALEAIVAGLERAVNHFTWRPPGTEWGDYYSFTNYSDDAFKSKQEIVDSMLAAAKPGSVWDVGANCGVFSRVAARHAGLTLSLDADPVAVEKNYLQVRARGEKGMLPLLMDLTNPSGQIGWANSERGSLIDRGPADAVMALALIHHLAISNNTPLAMLAEFFASIGKSLIIEFVPKSDSQVQRLLTSREDVFPNYNQLSFEAEFSRHFSIDRQALVPATERTLYLMTRR